MSYLDEVKERFGEDWIDKIELDQIDTTIMTERFNEMVENNPSQKELDAFKDFDQKLEELKAYEFLGSFIPFKMAYLDLIDLVQRWEAEGWSVSEEASKPAFKFVGMDGIFATFESRS